MDTVNAVFFFSSVAMVAVIAWMAWQDYDRDWKQYQRQFMKKERQIAKWDMEQAKVKVDQEKIAQLEKDLAAEEESFKFPNVGKWMELHGAEEGAANAEAQLEKKKTRMAEIKSHLDAMKYQVEEARRHGAAQAVEKDYVKLAQDYLGAKEEFMQSEAGLKKAEAAVAALTERRDQLEKALDHARLESKLLGAKIEKLTITPTKLVLNAPILDFISPTFKIRQVVLPDLHDDYNFLEVGKVDRCQTCHLGIEKPSVKDADGNILKIGYDGANIREPFRTHPQPALYVLSSSKHPLDKFGCSTCHRGVGHAVSFLDAGHIPQDVEQLAAWSKKYHYKPLDHEHLSDFLWDDMMHPNDMVEASCLKCHQGMVEIPEAPRLNAGRRLFEDYGCYGCHKTAGFTDLRKPGPPLTHVEEKVSKDWVKKWLKNPKHFRPTTRMPRFFDLSNTSTPEDMKRSDAEIEAIAAYIFERARPQTTFDAPPFPGDAHRGKELFERVGCLGCHSMTATDHTATNFGPDLSAIGSKIKDRAWLYTWVKDPKRYFPNTKMPSLRLTDEEASDITAYLMSLKNDEFDRAPVPAGSDDEVDAILREAWSAKMTQAAISEKLQGMTSKEKWLAAGEKMIGHYGCFGCHDVGGFEKANPIGTELTEEGSKDLDKLDFGGIHGIPHERISWFTQKLTDPRSFDEGKVKDRFDKLRMPNFDFTPDQARLLITHIQSLTKEKVRLDHQRQLSAREQVIEKGRRMVRDHNCYGCHTVDGHTGGIRAYYQEDPGLAPPLLFGEGKKVQSYWLYEFLKSPAMIRPWLNVRMPTFGFTDEEATALVNYFQALDDVQTVYRPKDFHKPDPQMAAVGRQMFMQLQCAKCHVVGSTAPPGRAAGDLAPDLSMAKTRLNPEWIPEWLEDPTKLMPGTRMPSFFADGTSPLPAVLDGKSDAQRRALRDYLLSIQN